MEALYALLIVLAFAVLIYVLWNTKSVVVFEFERGLFYKRGKFERLLEPGQHWYFRAVRSVQKMDVRTRLVTLPGQEMLSSDNVGIKVTLVCSYKVDDPYRATMDVQNYVQSLYAELQVNLRDIVGETPIDDLLVKRKEIGEELLNRTQDTVLAFGVFLESVAVKDIMFPGELRRIFAQVVNAKMEGRAALERARGESAAMRNLANSAKLLEKNPGLLQLRILQTLDNNPGNTIILGDMTEKAVFQKLKQGETEKTGK